MSERSAFFRAPRSVLRRLSSVVHWKASSTIGEEIMARVALVTGGTRGIGAAISKALKAAGYKVAATYGSSDEAAQKFKAETGINVYKWDVSSFDACAAGVKQVEADLGP